MPAILKPRIALLAACLATSSATGGLWTYQCEIKQQMEGKDDGTVETPQLPWLIGARFAIERKSGRIVGPESSMWTFADSEFQVLASGNEGNSFISTASSPSAGGGVHLTVINVREYASGRRKPFTAMSGSTVYAGLCE